LLALADLLLSVAGEIERTGGKAPGPIGTLFSKSFGTSRKATNKSASTGRKARGYRSPSWDLSPHSVELMLKHGFVYDSSMMGDDYTPYYARQGDVIELRYVEHNTRIERQTRFMNPILPSDLDPVRDLVRSGKLSPASPYSAGRAP
jgi:hypothetical protein